MKAIRWKKEKIVLVVVGMVLLVAILLANTVTSFGATPFQTSIEHTKKITIHQKGYLKVTSSREVNHTLFRDKIENPKGAQCLYGNEVYFAVVPGVYYLRSSQLADFTLRCQRYKVPKGYKKNTSVKTAKLLKENRAELAISYEGDKNLQRYRYYKIIPKKDAGIAYIGGTLYDSHMKQIPCLTCKVIPRVYGSKDTKKKSIGDLQKNVSLEYSFTYGLYQTMEPLQAGETYYLKVDLTKYDAEIANRGKRTMKPANRVAKVAWEYQKERIHLK